MVKRVSKSIKKGARHAIILHTKGVSVLLLSVLGSRDATSTKPAGFRLCGEVSLCKDSGTTTATKAPTGLGFRV